MQNLCILSTGKAIPAIQVSSEMLDHQLKRSPGYTYKKSGVRMRRFSEKSQTQSELGSLALCDALKNRAIDPNSIDLLISACGVQEQALPSTACAIAAHAGLLEGTPAFDVNASCLSFLVALNLAASLLNSETYQRIAIVSADQPSRGMDWDTPEASLIFGDGAACAIVEKGNNQQIIRSFLLKTFAEGRKFCEIRAGGSKCNPASGADSKDYLFSMNGKEVLRLALQKMPAFLEELTSEIPLESIDVIVPHQASKLSMTRMVKRLGLDSKRIINIFETHGNQVAASIPTALHEAIVTGKIMSGKRALLLGTGAGLSIGGLILDC